MNRLLTGRSAKALFLAILLALPAFSFAKVSSSVFQYFNANGKQETSNPVDPSLADVNITSYKPEGTSVPTTLDAVGNYSFTTEQVANGLVVRVEFTALPNYVNQVMVGGILVQFLTTGETATNKNLSVSFPGDFRQTNPQMATPCYVSTGATYLDDVVNWSYNSSDSAIGDETSITNSGQVGSLWGVAYSRFEKLIYTSAVLASTVPQLAVATALKGSAKFTHGSNVNITPLPPSPNPNCETVNVVKN